MQLCCVSTLSIDPHLGRLDFDSLNDQARMEILVHSFDHKHIFQDKNGNFLELADWRGLTLDNEENVLEIMWTNIRFGRQVGVAVQHGGTVAMEWLPPNTCKATFFGTNLRGTVETSSLPQSMQSFDITVNKLCGAFDLAGLPCKIEKLFLSLNAFSGSLALEALPETLREFEANDNSFSGSLTLNHLPEALFNLSLARNKVTGTICLKFIPISLRALNLRGNQFTQDKVTLKNANVDKIVLNLRETGISRVCNEAGQVLTSENVYDIFI